MGPLFLLLFSVPILVSAQAPVSLTLLEPDPDVWCLETSESRGLKARFNALVFARIPARSAPARPAHSRPKMGHGTAGPDRDLNTKSPH